MPSWKIPPSKTNPIPEHIDVVADTPRGEAPRTDTGRLLAEHEPRLLAHIVAIENEAAKHWADTAFFLAEETAMREAASATPQSTPGATGDYYRARREAASATPEGLPLDVERLADDVRWGFPKSDYSRGFNDGIDALIARLSESGSPTLPPDWRVSTTYGRYVGAAPPPPGEVAAVNDAFSDALDDAMSGPTPPGEER